MALTFEETQSKYEDWTKDDSSTNQTRGQDLINGKEKEILGLKNWWFMEKERTASSVADQQDYRMPADYGRLFDLWTVVDSNNYHPTYVGDLGTWRRLNNTGTSVTSETTTRYAIIEDHVYLYPTPSSADITIHMLYRRKAPEMSADDYTTGTISNTAGSTTVTGSGTTFTAAMEGRWIKIDGRWYQIETRASNTSLTLEKSTLSGCSSASYKLGEMSVIPHEFHDILWKGAVAEYFALKREIDRSQYWEAKYNARLSQLRGRYGSKTSYQVIPPKHKTSNIRNPNDYPTSLS